jgi:hypothetical protein
MQNKPRILTEAFIKALKPAPADTRYSVTDALVPGFSVRVTDKGTKTFILWRRIDPRASSASALKLGRRAIVSRRAQQGAGVARATRRRL